MIFSVGAVRHMSVRASARADQITDNHGRRPREPATSQVMAWMSRPGVRRRPVPSRGPVFVYRVRTRARGPRPTGRAWPGQSPAGGRGDSWFPAPVVRPPSLRIHRRYAGTGPRRRTRRVSGRSQRPVPGVLAGDRTGKGRYVEPGPRGSQRLIHHRPRTAYLA